VPSAPPPQRDAPLMNATQIAAENDCHGEAPMSRAPRYVVIGMITSGVTRLSWNQNRKLPNSAAGSADASCGMTW
jgi:hypothetical protein